MKNVFFLFSHPWPLEISSFAKPLTSQDPWQSKDPKKAQDPLSIFPIHLYPKYVVRSFFPRTRRKYNIDEREDPFHLIRFNHQV